MFIHLPIEEHLGYFQLLAIINKATVNIHDRFLGEHTFNISSLNI